MRKKSSALVALPVLALLIGAVLLPGSVTAKKQSKREAV